MSEYEPHYEAGKHERIDDSILEKRREQIERERSREAAKAEAERDLIETIRERLVRAQEKQEAPKLHKQEGSQSEAAHYSSTGLKEHALNITNKRVQKQLSKPERAFSKLIHQPAVEAVSDAVGATVARPSGLLAGGLMSVIFSLAIFYISRHYGYEYNFMVGLAGLAIGFLTGFIIEGVLKLFRRR